MPQETTNDWQTRGTQPVSSTITYRPTEGVLCVESVLATEAYVCEDDETLPYRLRVPSSLLGGMDRPTRCPHSRPSTGLFDGLWIPEPLAEGIRVTRSSAG